MVPMLGTIMLVFCRQKRWYENKIWGGGDIARALLSDPAMSGRSPQVVCASRSWHWPIQDGTEFDACRPSAQHPSFPLSPRTSWTTSDGSEDILLKPPS